MSDILERAAPKKLCDVKLGSLLQIFLVVTFVIGGVILVLLVRQLPRSQALAEAESKARTVLPEEPAEHASRSWLGWRLEHHGRAARGFE